MKGIESDITTSQEAQALHLLWILAEPHIQLIALCRQMAGNVPWIVKAHLLNSIPLSVHYWLKSTGHHAPIHVCFTQRSAGPEKM